MKTLMAMMLMAGLTATLGAQDKKAPGEHSMTGCLQKGTQPNSYLLDNVEGKGPKSVGIVSSAANLAPHVGHKIEITGVNVPATEAESDKNVPRAPHYMKLSGIKMISTTCP